MDNKKPIQYVKISLSNGRTAVFVGPFLVDAEELKKGELKVTDLYFSEAMEH